MKYSAVKIVLTSFLLFLVGIVAVAYAGDKTPTLGKTLVIKSGYSEEA